jgi:hypothetical protein
MGLIYLLNMHCIACFDSISSANTIYEMLHLTPSIMLIKVKPQILVAICSEINTKHINTVWAEHKIVEC